MKILTDIFKKKLKTYPKGRQVYAVGTGTYVGEMFVYIRTTGESYSFISLPKLINREIPIDKFNWAIEHKIIEFVQVLPKKVYDICYKQYFYNLKPKETKDKELK